MLGVTFCIDTATSPRQVTLSMAQPSRHTLWEVPHPRGHCSSPLQSSTFPYSQQATWFKHPSQELQPAHGIK